MNSEELTGLGIFLHWAHLSTDTHVTCILCVCASLYVCVGGDLKLGLPTHMGFTSRGHVLEQVFRKLAGNLKDLQANHCHCQRLRSK